MVANVAAALGPPLGGVLVEYASWHWIFAINVPIGMMGVALALRVMPETYDLAAGDRVDWLGMVLIGSSVFALTYALVEANSLGWGSATIVSLLVAAVLLGVAFAASQRLGRFPMLVPALTRNRQFMGASAAMLLFATGMMGMLFLAVIAFVNLWGYSQIDAALAVAPVPLVGIVVSPLVGRGANRVQPRAVALPALAAMAVGLLLLAGFPARPDYPAVLPALILIGLGMGMMFPAVSVGAMGSIRGQELGLGSGIVNMSRQVGFAIGVAILVAVFTGVLDDRGAEARERAAALARTAGYSDARRDALLDRAFAGRAGEGAEPFVPRDAVERRTAVLAADAARDAFAASFRVAALCVVLAMPFTLTMRRSPGEVHAAPAVAAAG